MALDTSLPISNKGANGSPITDSNGNPVQGVEVTLWRRVLDDTNSDGEGDEITDTQLLARKQTDSNGEYEFTENDLPVTYTEGESEVIYYCTVHAVHVASGSGDPLDNGRIKAYNAANEPAASDYMTAYSLKGALPVTNGLENHYDATALTGFSAGDPVGTWTDEAGTDDLTQTTSSRQPEYLASGIGGNATLYFDGSDDRINMTRGSNLSQPYQIFVVGRFRSTDLSTWIIGGQNSAATRNDLGIGSGSTWLINSGTGVNSGTSDTNNHIHSIRYNSPDTLHRVDGVDKLNGDTGTDDSAGIEIGDTVSSGNNGAVNVGEVLFYNRELTSSEVSDVENYLSSKWGITL